MPKYKDCRGFITGLGVSVPPHRFSQAGVGGFMKRHMLLDEKLGRWVDLLVKQSKINFRHSVIPDYGTGTGGYQFFPNNESLTPFPGVSARMKAYKQHALPLAVSAAEKCMRSAGGTGEITHLIVVSCTGMYAPGLDVGLVGALGLPGSVSRTCINFMGCYAAFNALKVASAIVGADDRARVLLVCVELCSLHFQKESAETNHLLTNMLFADGASAALVEAVPSSGKPSFAVVDYASDLFPEGKDEMTWEISDFGFAMKLTGHVPEVLRNGVGGVLERLLQANNTGMGEVRHFAFHPGGPRVLEVLEKACNISPSANRWAYETLRDFGNMSSATLFFVLQKIMENEVIKAGDLVLSAAFGPGLTCESALLRVTV
ncbi:type III polyketide synthase [Ravibacter arvi]|uniref:Type III polyketide synthase n=1 Tax=Ravibacter arvi TaxID=2051041 RepID=A0ABP8LYE9_9BACT